MYLFQFLANEVEGLKDGIRRAGNGNDPFRTGSIRNVDAGTRLIKYNSFFYFSLFYVPYLDNVSEQLINSHSRQHRLKEFPSTRFPVTQFTSTSNTWQQEEIHISFPFFLPSQFWLHFSRTQNTRHRHDRRRRMFQQQKPIKLEKHEKWYLSHSPFLLSSAFDTRPKKSIHYLFVKTSPDPNGYVPPLGNVWRSRLSCQWYFQLPAMTQSK